MAKNDLLELRKREIKEAAAKCYIDSQLSTVYCGGFIIGAHWSDNNPLSPWRKFSEELPEKNSIILVGWKGGCHIRFVDDEPQRYANEGYPYWMQVPLTPDCKGEKPYHDRKSIIEYLKRREEGPTKSE